MAGLIDIDKLTPAERLELIGELWDSLESEDVPLSPAQQAELERRLETLEEDKKHAVSWETLKAELDARRR